MWEVNADGGKKQKMKSSASKAKTKQKQLARGWQEKKKRSGEKGLAKKTKESNWGS